MSTRYKRTDWVRRREVFSSGCSSGFRLGQWLIAGILAIFTGISRLLPVTRWLSVTLSPSSLRGVPSCAVPKGVAMRASIGRWRSFINWLFESLTPGVPVVSTVGASSLKFPASIWRGVVFVALVVGMMAMGRVAWADIFFVDSGQELGQSNSYGVALGDVDGDGDIDAFVSNLYSQPDKVWLNNGSGIFTDSGQTLGNLYSHDVGLGDLDGDGDIDAFVSGASTSGGAGNKVWLNDGLGNFTDSGQSLGNGTSFGVALGDLDGDNDIDAIVSNSGPDEVWINDGFGDFTNVQ